MRSDRYPALGHVIGAYFHEDAGNMDDAIELYLEDGAEFGAEALAELDLLLATESDADLPRLSRRLGNSWEVTRHGMTYRQFFEWLRERIRAHAG